MRPSNQRVQIVAVSGVLVALNLAAWAWALIAFRDYPVQLGTALLAYGLGLRHAFDADHIAAIDSVTRKLMHDGRRPVTVGLFFSLGHSTIVIVASAVVALTAATFHGRLGGIRDIGGVVGTLTSAAFLLAIAAMNGAILLAVYRTFRRVKNGGTYTDEDFDVLLAGRGLLARLLRPLFRAIRRSWHMYPLGLLFGLGFDTATEIALLGISAAQASRGMSWASILVFPALFTAGMALADTIDGILMLGAYGWAFVKPIRKLYYNLVITFASVVVALVIGSVEALGLLGRELGFAGSFWDSIAALNEHFGTLGYLIVILFVLCWAGSTILYRLRGYDRLEIRRGVDSA